MHSLSITCSNGSTVITVYNEKSKYHHPLTRHLTLLSFHPRPPNEPLPKTALLQPSGSDTSTGSERISRLPFCLSTLPKKFFCSTPRTLRLSACVCQGGAREARDDRFFGEKKIFFGGRFHGTPQFLKPQILAETLKPPKKKENKLKSTWFAPNGKVQSLQKKFFFSNLRNLVHEHGEGIK